MVVRVAEESTQGMFKYHYGNGGQNAQEEWLQTKQLFSPNTLNYCFKYKVFIGLCRLLIIMHKYLNYYALKCINLYIHKT